MQWRKKSWVHLFRAAVSGEKTHDIRRAEGFKVGDTIILDEYDQGAGRHTGWEAEFKITYITSSVVPCAFSSSLLSTDYVVLSISKMCEPRLRHSGS